VADLPDAVSVAYIHSNTVTYSWHFSLLQLFVADLGTHQRIRRGGIIAMRTNAGQLVNARNKAVGHLLESDVPWMLWLDTDMGFGPDILEQLLAAADPVERPIVGALCFAQRELEMDGMGGYHTIPTPTIFDWAPIGDLEGYEIRYDYPANALIRCSGTGSAAILVHRSVFERIFEKYGPEWYHRVPARNGSMGEDLSFCMRATALDIPVHVHTGVRTTHAKTVWLGEGDFLEQVMVPPATDEAAVLVPVLGRPEHAEPFMASLRASTGLATAYALVDPEDAEAVAAWDRAGAAVLLDPQLRLEVNDAGLPTGNQRPGTFAEKVNFGYAKTGEPWLLLVGSDVRFHPGWLDQALAAAGDRYHVIGTNDLANPRVMAGDHATHPLIRRSYVDEVGASWDGPGIVAHEGYRHWFVDDEIVTAAKQRGVWAPALASRVEHLHPLVGKGEQDETYRVGQLHIEADKALFDARLAKHGGETP
jgi:GT2 family glycosyltransferase